MSEPFLILHKVRGEPAFDIAERMDCAVCHADPDVVDFNVPTTKECHECNGEGYWWIIPTSGHRAYPYWNQSLGEIVQNDIYFGVTTPEDGHGGIIPNDWPDHYPSKSSPAPTPLSSLLSTIVSSVVPKLRR